jgi:TP901 family phage tail tape measure protein
MSDNNLKLRFLFDMVDRLTKPLKTILSGSNALSSSLKASRDQLDKFKRAHADIDSYKAARAELGKTATALRSAEARMQTLAAQIRATSSPTAKMRREFQGASRQVAALNERHRSQASRLTELRERMGAAGRGTQTLAEHERGLKARIEQTTAAIQQQQRQLTSLATREKQVAAARAKMEHLRTASGAVATKGAVAIGAGAGAMFGMRRLIAPGIEFDAEMSRVQALTRLEKTSQELQGLRAQARELGANTSFSATQAAAGQGFLGMAGFSHQEIKQSMPGMLDLARAGDTELAETADIASNILTGFGLSADQMTRVGDVLTSTFTQANTDLAKLGETMKYAAPMAKTYGVSFETTSAMAGKLGDAGLQGSVAGTGIAAVMNRLAAPEAAAARALDKLRIETKDGSGNLRDLPTIFAEIHERTKAMGTAERGALLKAIAGTEHVKSLATLVDQSGSGELQKLIATLGASKGEAAKTAATMSDNLAGDWKSLTSAWENLNIQLFDENDSALRKIVGNLTAVVRSVGEWARANPKLVATLSKVAAVGAVLLVSVGSLAVAIAGALLPLALVRFSFAMIGVQASTLSRALSVGTTAWNAFGKAAMIACRAILMNPIGLAIGAAVAVIAGAAYLIYRYWEPITAFFADLWGRLNAVFAGGIAAVGACVLNWSPLGLFYSAFAAVLSWFGVDVPAKFSEFGANMLSGLVSGITRGLGAVKDAIATVADSTVGWFKKKLGIQSPSRVFGELGGFISQGAAIGMEGEQRSIARAATALATAAVTSFGAPTLALATNAANSSVVRDSTPVDLLPANTTARLARQTPLLDALRPNTAAAPGMRPIVPFDARPPLSSSPASSYAASTTSHIVINVHPPAGTDATEIGRMVRAELERAERAKQSRIGSRLSDSSH